MCVRRGPPRPDPDSPGAKAYGRPNWSGPALASVAAYAQRLAEALVAQGVEVDNLGDGESVVLTDACPTINLQQLAEHMLGRASTE